MCLVRALSFLRAITTLQWGHLLVTTVTLLHFSTSTAALTEDDTDYIANVAPLLIFLNGSNIFDMLHLL